MKKLLMICPINFLEKSTVRNMLGNDIIFTNWGDISIYLDNDNIKLFNAKKEIDLTTIGAVLVYQSNTQIPLVRSICSKLNIPMYPNPLGISNTNKPTMGVLLQGVVPIPDQIIIERSDRTIFKFIEEYLDYPYLIKPVNGSLGKGILMCDNSISANLLHQSMEKDYISQQYIENSGNCYDERYIFVDNTVVCGHKKWLTNPGDIRTNLALGNRGESISNISGEIKTICSKISDKLNLDIFGLDIKRNKEGKPFVIDVNPYPSTSCISAAKHNFITDIVNYIKKEL